MYASSCFVSVGIGGNSALKSSQYGCASMALRPTLIRVIFGAAYMALYTSPKTAAATELRRHSQGLRHLLLVRCDAKSCRSHINFICETYQLRVCQCRRCIDASPIGVAGKGFFSCMLWQALELADLAEEQQEQIPHPDARIAFSRYLQAAHRHVCHGHPIMPMPQAIVALAGVASRVLASLAAMPHTASAASCVMLAINNIIADVSSTAADSSRLLAEARHLLLASAELLLDEPRLLLTAAGIAAHGPVDVTNLALSIFYGISVALCVNGVAVADPALKLLAQLQQQCFTLLADPTVAAQLKRRVIVPFDAPAQRRHSCSEELAHLVEVTSSPVLSFMKFTMDNPICLHSKITFLADHQILLVALSAAAIWPLRLQALELNNVEMLQEAVLTTYDAAVFLRKVLAHATEALQHCPSLVWQATGLVTTLAGVAASALAFGEYDSHTDQRPADVGGKLPGCMQFAAEAANYMHLLAQCLPETSHTNRVVETARSALNTQRAVPALIQLLHWLAKPTTPIATASGVLKEALPAVRLMAVNDEDLRHLLAAPEGPREWAPVAKALRQRLPRRMAARFLPEVDRVSAAVAGRGACATKDDPAVVAAEAAMAALLQARIA